MIEHPLRPRAMATRPTVAARCSPIHIYIYLSVKVRVRGWRVRGRGRGSVSVRVREEWG